MKNRHSSESAVESVEAVEVGSKRQIPAKHGGFLIRREHGDAALPGAGRPPNPFKAAIRQLSEGGKVEVKLKGWLLNEKGEKVGEKRDLVVELPGVEGIVAKMFQKAAKGDVHAAKFLSEHGFGKLSVRDSDESSGDVSYAIILPPNQR